MKFKILFSVSLLAIALIPSAALAEKAIQKQSKIEAVFVLDTTGSMGGLIQAAKDKIWSIANTMASAKPTPEIKIGLIAYRDRGDAYITKFTQLSNDLDAVYTAHDLKCGL